MSKKRYIFTDADRKRGANPTLSRDPNDPTVAYPIKMPLSLKQKCKRVKARRVREAIEEIEE